MAQGLTKEQMIADIRAEIAAQQEKKPCDRRIDLVLLAFQVAASLGETLSTRMVARVIGQQRRSVQEAMADLHDMGQIEYVGDKPELNRVGKTSHVPHYQLVRAENDQTSD